MVVHFQSEQKTDYESVDRLLEKAFGGTEERTLVQALRNHSAYFPDLAVVQRKGSNLVGYLLLSEAKIVFQAHSQITLALAPMAIHPAWQKQGLGSALVKEALSRARQNGYASIFVVGHADYYPRFGFQPAKKFQMTSPWNIPDDVFMALELKEGSLAGGPGRIQYAEPFSQL